MTARGTVSLSLLLALALPHQSARTAQDVPQFRTRTTAVAVPVVVRLKGRPATDLKVEDFALTDNGVPQQVTLVTGAAVPLDISLVVRSTLWPEGSQRQSYAREIGQVVQLLRPGDRLRLVTAGNDIHQTIFSDSPSLDGTEPQFDRCFPLYDALTLALMRPPDPNRQHVIIVIADDEGEGNVTPPSTVLDLIRRSEARIFLRLTERTYGVTRDKNVSLRPVCSAMYADWAEERRARLRAIDRMSSPFYEQDPGLWQLQRERLVGLTLESGGGDLGRGRVGDPIARQVQRALDEARASYILYYQPSGVAEQGWHPIEVRVTRPGRYDVRTRTGFLR